MGKILISWVATENDFIKDKSAENPNGPNSLLHKHFYTDYDYHLLLSSKKNTSDDTKYQFLVTYLRKEYKGHKIIERAMSINDVIDIKEISAKVNTLLLSNKEHSIDIFVSPGTPTMQVAWYLAHQTLGLKTRLFQMRRPEHSKNKESEQVWIELEKSDYTSSLIIRQESPQSLNEKQQNIVITQTLKKTYDKAKKIAEADCVSVLIGGETGSGKELLAKYIHDNSPRAKGTFVAINCSALSNELLESRLFGYEKGAFTGANERTTGLFHEADGGTIFLDEIGDITPYMQQCLLRALQPQKKEILRVGSRKPEIVDVRVISATNRNLYDMCNKKEFRPDLYYRLAVTDLYLPSLKEYTLKEKEEVFNFLWQKSKVKFNKKEPKIRLDIKKRILEYLFPGNIREMENLVDRIFAEAHDTVLLENLPDRILNPSKEHSLLLKDIELRHCRYVYEMCNKNLERTRIVLGITANTLKSKLKNYNIK
ncbi:MAG: sigma 54-interacting transcriptional regulator [Chitinophagales bacterium]